MIMIVETLAKSLKNNNLYLEIGKKILTKFFQSVFNTISSLLNLINTLKIKMEKCFKNANILFLIISCYSNTYINIFLLRLGVLQESTLNV
jgi:hypothetical protein